MKKTFTLIVFLIAIAYCGFAQDTITGVVNRVDAPFFEQNVCDSRFAIVSEGETYYVMVDNYWPNLYLEDLIIHYDTIPIGKEIVVVGEIMEMEDGNGEAFNIIDIQELVNAIYGFGTGYINWIYHFATIKCNIPPTYACFIAINGELQETSPIVFNGITLDDGIYTAIGIVEFWPDYELPILELTHVIPYIIENTATGIIVADAELCLTTPCNGGEYLSWSDNDGKHYLTNKDKLLNNSFYGAIWGDHVSSTINGFGNTHFDLFGSPFQTFETISMETSGERTIQGKISAVTAPSTGIPISLAVAISQDGYHYFIENLDFFEYGLSCIFDGDTLQMGTDVMAEYSFASLFLGDWLAPHFSIHIDSIRVDPTLVQENSTCYISVYPNPTDEVIKVVSNQLIKSISAYDYTGRILLNKPCDSKQALLDLKDYKGLSVIHILLDNGQSLSRKVVIQ